MRLVKDKLNAVRALLLVLGVPHAAVVDAETVSPKIHCAVYEEAPWNFGADGERQGVASYYAEKFSKASGHQIVLHPMPYKRSIRSILLDEIDFVLALSNTELEASAVPYVQVGRVAVLMYSNRPIDELYAAPEDKVELALMSGLEGNKDIDIPAWMRVITNSEASAIRAVALGRMDVTVVTRNTYEYMVAKEPDLAKGYIRDMGFAHVYAWMSKDKAGQQPFADAKQIIETHAFGGQLVLDWYTVSLPVIPDHY